MLFFLVGLAILLAGYFLYGTLIEKVFGPDESRQTPAVTMADGVDYVELGEKKNIFIQLLNIAGTGPILGGIAGALFGVKAFIIIAVGNIIGGAVHDYLVGMISVRNGGAHLPALSTKYLGRYAKHIINLFALLVLFLVGVVFVITPAQLIQGTFFGGSQTAYWIAIVCIFVYYVLATILPVDKVIGKVYPIFGGILLFSAVLIAAGLIIGWSDLGQIPNLDWSYVVQKDPIFPMFFMSIACGLMSGFHATQSPIVARTLKTEKHGRRAFYGAMVLEGIIAMVWAAAAITLFHVIGTDKTGLAFVVKEVATRMLGTVAGGIAVLGVVVLPITSGDTAFRSARNIIADYLKLDQKPIVNRYIVALPLFALAGAIVFLKIDYMLIWRYFVWANQVTASIALLTAAAYLFINKNFNRLGWLFAYIPGVFMLACTNVYIINNPTLGFGVNNWAKSTWMGLVVTAVIAIGLIFVYINNSKNEALKD